jgi:hypothetical protein
MITKRACIEEQRTDVYVSCIEYEGSKGAEGSEWLLKEQRCMQRKVTKSRTSVSF